MGKMNIKLEEILKSLFGEKAYNEAKERYENLEVCDINKLIKEQSVEVSDTTEA